MIIQNNRNQVFLLRRSNTGWRDGWWTVPAGHVEKDESPTHAAIRELEEEAGVSVTPGDLTSPLTYFYPADDRQHERVSVFFSVTSYKGKPTNAEPHKADRGEWFDIDSLPDNIVPMLKVALTDMKNGVSYSDRFYDPAHSSELHT